MKIVPCSPSLLPLKNLNYSRLLCAVGKTREALARYDEQLLKLKKPMNLLEKFIELDLIQNAPNSELFDQIKTSYLFAYNWTQNKKPFTASFFCSLHQIVKHGGNPKEVGSFRKWQNWIGPQGEPISKAYFLPPVPEKVPKLMRNLTSYLARKTEEPLIQLAVSFAQTLIIHPFMDGNGRVGRMLIPVFLWKRGILSQPLLFMGRYFKENRLAYFQKLYNISADHAWEEWILFFLKGLTEEAENKKILIGKVSAR